MTTTTPSLTSTAPEIATFADSVRAALADLPPEELDDLTDGLEADLAERAADADDKHPADLGDPAAYAEELRAAAGYPPRAARSHLGGTLPSLRTLPQELARRATAFRDAHPAVRAAAAFFVTLRPVWWVFRGWAVYMFCGGAIGGYLPVPSTLLGWIVLIAALVVSVQFGRGRWLPSRWMRRALLLLNVALIIAAPFVTGWAIGSVQNANYNQYYDDSAPDYSNGALIEAGGQQVSNIFAYDAQGNLIPQVQLFDQDGNPLNLVAQTDLAFTDSYPSADGNSDYVLVPNGDVPGRPGWNVYPLGRVDYTVIDQSDGTLPSNAHVTSPAAPFVIVKPLSGSEPAPGSTASPIPTPSPSPGN